MPFVLHCLDRPDAADLRQANREAHLAYVAETGIVRLAGPLLDETGGMIGSLLVLDTEALDEATVWARDDPYARAGVFAETRLHRWRQVVP